MADITMEVGQSVVVVQIPGVGGFPAKNISYWKYEQRMTDDGMQPILRVQFKHGGFIELPGMTEETFAEFVFGTNPPF